MPYDFSKQYTPREFSEYILLESENIPFPTFSNQIGHVTELIRIDRKRQWDTGYFTAMEQCKEPAKLVNALQYIIDIGFDHDGYHNSKDLGELIDNFVDVARKALAVNKEESNGKSISGRSPEDSSELPCV